MRRSYLVEESAAPRNSFLLNSILSRDVGHVGSERELLRTAFIWATATPNFLTDSSLSYSFNEPMKKTQRQLRSLHQVYQIE